MYKLTFNTLENNEWLSREFLFEDHPTTKEKMCEEVERLIVENREGVVKTVYILEDKEFNVSKIIVDDKHVTNSYTHVSYRIFKPFVMNDDIRKVIGMI